MILLRQSELLVTVAHCRPTIGGKHFARSASCTAAIWFRLSALPRGSSIQDRLAAKLRKEGWELLHLEEIRKVSAADYEDNVGGRPHFEQALIDGFVGSVFLEKREVSDESIGDSERERLLVAFLSLRNGLFTIVESNGYPHIIKSTRFGNHLPIWAAHEPAPEIWRRRSREAGRAIIRLRKSHIRKVSDECQLVARVEPGLYSTIGVHEAMSLL